MQGPEGDKHEQIVWLSEALITTLSERPRSHSKTWTRKAAQFGSWAVDTLLLGPAHAWICTAPLPDL